MKHFISKCLLSSSNVNLFTLLLTLLIYYDIIILANNNSIEFYFLKKIVKKGNLFVHLHAKEKL